MAITLWTELTLAREAVGEEIVTIEVIVEEIVADLSDEFDVREDPTGWIGKPGERDYLVSARIDPGVLSEALEIALPKGQYATLAGFLRGRVRDVPAVGTLVRCNKFSFVIQRGSERAIEEVRIQW